MGEVQARPRSVIIPLPDPAFRPKLRALAAHEPRGEILLFTGVRYERQPDPPLRSRTDTGLTAADGVRKM